MAVMETISDVELQSMNTLAVKTLRYDSLITFIMVYLLDI